MNPNPEQVARDVIARVAAGETVYVDSINAGITGSQSERDEWGCAYHAALQVLLNPDDQDEDETSEERIEEILEEQARVKRQFAPQPLTAHEIAYARKRKLDLKPFGYSNRPPRRVPLVRRAARAARSVTRAMSVGTTASGSSPPAPSESSAADASGSSWRKRFGRRGAS